MQFRDDCRKYRVMATRGRTQREITIRDAESGERVKGYRFPLEAHPDGAAALRYVVERFKEQL